MLPWPEVLQQLKSAEDDLRAAVRNFRTSDLRLQAEACFYLGRVVEEQAHVRSQSRAGVQQLSPAEVVKLRNTAASEFAHGAAIARKQDGTMDWPSCQLEQASILRGLKNIDRAIELTEEVLSDPSTAQVAPNAVFDACKSLLDMRSYDSVPADAHERLFDEHQTLLSRGIQSLDAIKPAASKDRLVLLEYKLKRLRTFDALTFANTAPVKKRRELWQKCLEWREESRRILSMCEPTAEVRAAESISWRDYGEMLWLEFQWRNDGNAKPELLPPATIKPGEDYDYLVEIAKAYDRALALTIDNLDPQVGERINGLVRSGDSVASVRTQLNVQSPCLRERFDEHLRASYELRDLVGSFADLAYEKLRAEKKDSKDLPLMSAIANRAWRTLDRSERRLPNPVDFQAKLKNHFNVAAKANLLESPAYPKAAK